MDYANAVAAGFAAKNAVDSHENHVAAIAAAPSSVAPALTASQREAQAIIDKQDYLAMLRNCLPTLKSEHYAGRYLMAEMTNGGDVQVLKKQFIKAAKRVVGGLPPFTEVALQFIKAQGGK